MRIEEPTKQKYVYNINRKKHRRTHKMGKAEIAHSNVKLNKVYSVYLMNNSTTNDETGYESKQMELKLDERKRMGELNYCLVQSICV